LPKGVLPPWAQLFKKFISMFESRIAEPVLRTGIGTDTLGPTSILSLYLGPYRIIERQTDRMSVIEQATNPLSQFLYALKAPETKRQWPN
jgi:hypothetical protein